MPVMRRLVRGLALWMVISAAAAHALAQPAASAGRAQRLAVWRFDALGIEAELVARLEVLFRSELARLAAAPIAGQREIERKITGELAQCTGEDRCLAAIGKRLEVDIVVAGSVGALGDNYLLDIKAVEVGAGRQIARVTTEPLRGTPDELIESVRVAAYRLLAPEQVHGSIVILSDLLGGEVSLDGKRVGTTPLAAPLDRLPVGPHVVRVAAAGFAPFEEQVEVRFQKTARVEVRLVAVPGAVPRTPPPRRAAKPWYTRPWALVAIGAGAVAAGALVGYELRHVDRRCDNCAAQGLEVRW